MSFEHTKYVWQNGRLVPWSEATLHVASHALHYGSGVFEGIRCYETEQGPALFQLRPHLERFYQSAAVYGLEIPYPLAQLEQAVYSVIRANNFSACYVRPIAYYGLSSLGVHPRQCPVEVAVLTWPWGEYLGNGAQERGVRVTFSPWVKFHSSMMPTTAKACGQYLNSMLAVRDAAARGFDEALLLDAEGNIAEGSGENLFLVHNGVLRTNDEKSSILLGVTRTSVIEIARDLGYEVIVTTLTREALLSADEAFFTGTAVEVTPIREVDGALIGGGAPGPISLQLQRVFHDAVRGRNPRYAHWLSVVTPATVMEAVTTPR